MIDVYITKRNGWITIDANGFEKMRYLYYSKREAIKKWREKNDLQRKHLNIIEY